jgi:cytidylate kinase
MTVYVPVGLIAMAVTVYFTYEANRQRRLKQDRRREDKQEKLEELAQVLRRRKEKDEACEQAKKE